ncbi:Sushi domain-containing protein [Caenorhabditis elegans]|uniref:Sushi domain-containing protein n=1 Tax=Caenorhabditis elegans TaxID=6239 RepID=A0A8D8EK13_CAEEL|nr:Sushi domain-containing protein [Caenorhabditis elegans]CAG4685886.1 Sushi domain-containing protein [Caenorhabditis elegans]
MKIIIFCFILATLTASVTFGRKCDADLKPEKLVVVGVWKRGFDNSTAQYRISDEDLSVRGYERTESDKGSSTVMLARHPEGCVINECGVRLSAMMQNNGAILHTDYRMIRMNDSTMNNIEDEFYCAEKNNFCGADVPIYRLVKHSLTGPHYAYTFNDVGQSLPGYEKEFFPLCFAWRQTPSVVLFNSTDDGVCLTLPEVQNGKILYSNDQLNVFSIGTSATLECHQGFAGNGPSSLVCTKNGWYPKREDLGSCVRLEQSNKSRLLVASDVTPTSSSCRVPSSTPNGNIVYSANVATSTSINSVPTATRATVLCSLGHVPTTSVTSSKCVDGEWEPSLPTCLSLLDIKCPILSAPRNGELVFTNSVKSPYSLNSVISLKCDRNYFGTGNLTSTCTSTGWDQKIGQCEPHRYRIRRQASTGAVCAAIANPANGNLLYMQSNPTVQYSSGTSAYLMCNLGYSLSGSVSTLCSNGVWSPSIGQCTNALALGQTTGNCEAIPTRINGTITYSSFGTYTSGTIATLACNLMNTVSGSSTSTCLSGVWNPTIGNCVSSGGTGGTGTTCPNPTVINGQITYNQGNTFDTTRPALTTATLTCNSGYTRNGNYISTCLGGVFTPTLGTCTFGTSGSTGTACINPIIMNGQITYSQGNTYDITRPSGTAATLTCNSGYTISGSSQSTCTNGAFSPTLGTCNFGSSTGGAGTTCPNPTVVNGQVTYNQGNTFDATRPALTIATLTCNSGYTISGTSTSTCINGVFTPTLGTCTFGTSGSTGTACINPIIMNGQITYSQGNTYDITRPSGTVATLTCNSGYTISGSSQSTCTNGAFSPTLGTCNFGSSTGGTGTTCPNPTVVNGQITYSQGNTFDATRPALTTATLTCNSGYTISGTSISACMNGVFTPTLGTCTFGSSGSAGTACMNPYVINGQITYSQGNTYDITRPAGTTATLTCSSGYTVSGTSVSTCTNGIFTPTLGTCTLGSSTGGTGIQCTAMIAPLGGSVIYSNGGTMGPFPSGTTVTGSCTNGGAITGASTATCSNGMWNPTFLGTCSLIGGSTTGQCSALTIPSGAQATYSPFSLSTTSFTSGTVATVTCTTGGSMLGTSTCTNGLWSPAIMGTCSGTGTGNTCSALTRPVGETVTYDGTTSFATTFNSGVIARVTCSNGTQIGQSTCLVGQWTPAITATCSGSSTAVGSQCIGVIVPTNAQVTYSDGSMVLHSAGTTATLTCLNSATLTGSSYSSCSNGVWTPTLGSCTSSGTGTGPCYTPPLTPVGATLTYSSGYFAPWTAGSTATMSCPAGQTVIGTSISYCTNSAWSPALGSCSGSSVGQGCTPLSAFSGTLTNGRMSYSPTITATIPVGTMVNIVCYAGYTLSGNSISTCTSSGWSPSTVGSCIQQGVLSRVSNQNCAAMDTPNHGTFSYSVAGSFTTGTIVTLRCDTNYAATNGDTSAICTNGVWSPKSLAMCQRTLKEVIGASCPAGIPAVLAATMTYSNGQLLGPYPAATVVTATCQAGYIPTGIMTSTCTNGLWTPPSLGLCELIGNEIGGTSCGRLGEPLGGTLVYSAIGLGPYPTGTSATVLCNIGTTLSGSASSLCTNGVWNPLPGTCIATLLRKPPAKGVPENGTAADSPKVGNGTNDDTPTQIQLSGEKCPPPIAPAFGEITFSGFSTKGTFEDGTTAALKCNLGYKPTGPSFSTCRKGSFRPIIGKCSNGSEHQLPGVCVPLTPPKNARVVYIQSGTSLDFEDGTTALLYCEEGFAVTGVATLRCETGQWEPSSGFGMCDSI